MKTIKLSPDQIITLNDFPIHDEHVLKVYFRVFKEGCGKAVPPCPVIHRDLVAPFLGKNLSELFADFVKKNPEAHYFMLDGTHKTTAAVLTNHRIRAIIFRNEKDIQEAKKLVKTGYLFHYYLKDTIDGIIKELINHFKKTKQFQTVRQKTIKMANEKAIPKYMADYFKRK